MAQTLLYDNWPRNCLFCPPCSQTMELNFEERSSVVVGSVQVPENQTRGKKSLRTGAGTARISVSVLEPEPEPPKALGQFQNLNCFGISAPTIRNKSILFGCLLGKNKSLIEAKKRKKIENITV